MTANGSLRAPRLRTRRAHAPLSCPRRGQRATDLRLARDRQLDEASRLNPTCVDLGATQTIRRPANYIALRESLRWIPALVPFGFASLHSAGTAHAATSGPRASRRRAL